MTRVPDGPHLSAETVAELLADVLAGPGATAAAAHLAGCARCTALAAGLRGVRTALAADPLPPIPAEVGARVDRAIAAAAADRSTPHPAPAAPGDRTGRHTGARVDHRGGLPGRYRRAVPRLLAAAAVVVVAVGVTVGVRTLGQHDRSATATGGAAAGTSAPATTTSAARPAAGPARQPAAGPSRPPTMPATGPATSPVLHAASFAADVAALLATAAPAATPARPGAQPLAPQTRPTAPSATPQPRVMACVDAVLATRRLPAAAVLLATPAVLDGRPVGLVVVQTGPTTARALAVTGCPSGSASVVAQAAVPLRK